MGQKPTKPTRKSCPDLGEEAEIKIKAPPIRSTLLSPTFFHVQLGNGREDTIFACLMFKELIGSWGHRESSSGFSGDLQETDGGVPALCALVVSRGTS